MEIVQKLKPCPWCIQPLQEAPQKLFEYGRIRFRLKCTKCAFYVTLNGDELEDYYELTDSN